MRKYLTYCTGGGQPGSLPRVFFGGISSRRTWNLLKQAHCEAVSERPLVRSPPKLVIPIQGVLEGRLRQEFIQGTRPDIHDIQPGLLLEHLVEEAVFTR